MKKITLSGNVILDTDSELVSGNVTFKVNSEVMFGNLTLNNNKEFNFTRDFLVPDGSTYDISIHCYDNENNTYSLAIDNVPFPIENTHSQYCLTNECILSKDIIKLMYSN